MDTNSQSNVSTYASADFKFTYIYTNAPSVLEPKYITIIKANGFTSANAFAYIVSDATSDNITHAHSKENGRGL